MENECLSFPVSRSSFLIVTSIFFTFFRATMSPALLKHLQLEHHKSNKSMSSSTKATPMAQSGKAHTMEKLMVVSTQFESLHALAICSWLESRSRRQELY